MEERGKRNQGRFLDDGKEEEEGTHIGWPKCLFDDNDDASSLSGRR